MVMLESFAVCVGLEMKTEWMGPERTLNDSWHGQKASHTQSHI